jgi:hypothetical protein
MQEEQRAANPRGVVRAGAPLLSSLLLHSDAERAIGEALADLASSDTSGLPDAPPRAFAAIALAAARRSIARHDRTGALVSLGAIVAHAPDAPEAAIALAALAAERDEAGDRETAAALRARIASSRAPSRGEAPLAIPEPARSGPALQNELVERASELAVACRPVTLPSAGASVRVDVWPDGRVSAKAAPVHEPPPGAGEVVDVVVHESIAPCIERLAPRFFSDAGASVRVELRVF